MNPKKIIVTSKAALRLKYAGQFPSINAMLKKLKVADKKKKIDTLIVYIDDAASAKAAGIKPVTGVTPNQCKRAIDDLYKKHLPAYIAIVGAQDVIPFQSLVNPASDDGDDFVPSDLPYACDAGYSTSISAFTGPTRVVGRIPDIPESNDAQYLKTLIQNSINSKPQKRVNYENYFAVTASVWTKSTQQSLQSMFGNFSSLKIAPPAGKKYTAAQLKVMTHFYNCHGAHNDINFYGQKGNSYPVAFTSSQASGTITKATVVAAECCYGAELVAASLLPDPTDISIANNYLKNNAIAFLGSSTIAYGPADGQGLADLITQYFIKNVLDGASCGRALLQARQQFLTESGPQLDPYELKTVAQFHLLGDPSVQAVIDDNDTKAITSDTVANRRMKFAQKGADLKKNLATAQKQKTAVKSKHSTQINQLLKQAGISGTDKTAVFNVKAKVTGGTGAGKKLAEQDTKFRTFTKITSAKKFDNVQVLVVKESKEQLLGWKIYVRK